MKFKDLKTGMIVEARNGDIGLVMIDTINGDVIVADIQHTCMINNNRMISTDKMWRPLERYDFDLTHHRTKDEDIVRVYVDDDNYSMGLITTEDKKLIWERYPAKEMTVKEISDALGYSVTVVDK